MSSKPFLLLTAMASIAAAQIQLQPAPQSGRLIAALSNGDLLYVGAKTAVTSVGLDPSSSHSQISLVVQGTVPFPSGDSATLASFGGSGNDVPTCAAVDSTGNIWIAGNTDSDDFRLVNPIVSHKVPYRPAGFVLELDPTGTKLLFATYLAGQQPGVPFRTSVTALATDTAGNVYAGGGTNEPDFPTTPGAYQTRGPSAGSFSFPFVIKLSASGKLVYATFVGDNGGLEGLAVDNTGSATVAVSAEVFRFSPDGSELLWSSEIFAPDSLAMGQDSSGNVVLLGRYDTYIGAPPLPMTPGPPGLRAVKLNSSGSTVYSIDLGLSSDAAVTGVALDSSGNAYLAGRSSSPQFPVLSGVPNLGSDFVLRLDANGVVQKLFRFPQGTVFAPPAFDTKGNLLLQSSGGWLLTLPPNYNFDTPAIVGFTNAASFELSGIYPGELVSVFGFDLANSTQGVTAEIADLPATVLYAGPTQINLQVPFEAPSACSPAPSPFFIPLQISWPTGNIALALPCTHTLGLFTTDGIHAAATNPDGSVNSASNPAPAGSIVSLYGTGAVWHPGLDGVVATAAVPLPQQNAFDVIAVSGEPQSLPIIYAGTSPGMLYSVFQLNVQIEAPASPGTVGLPLTLQQFGPGGTLASNTVEVYVRLGP